MFKFSQTVFDIFNIEILIFQTAILFSKINAIKLRETSETEKIRTNTYLGSLTSRTKREFGSRERIWTKINHKIKNRN
jgi:hypothetical protein